MTKFLYGLSIVGALALAAPTVAAADTFSFSYGGAGWSAAGTLTYDTSLLDPISGGATITGITGTFSDAAEGLSDVSITGLVAATGNATPAGVAPFPAAMSYFSTVSYDDLFYPGGSPIVCDDYPFSGGDLDVYGVLFTVEGFANHAIDLYSAGDVGPEGAIIYGIAVGAPEPATWAMMGIGFAALGFAGYRQRRKAVAA